MRSSGLGAMVYAGAWLSDKFDLEVLSFGRESFAPKDSCKLELSGRFLAYDIELFCSIDDPQLADNERFVAGTLSLSS